MHAPRRASFALFLASTLSTTCASSPADPAPNQNAGGSNGAGGSIAAAGTAGSAAPGGAGGSASSEGSTTGGASGASGGGATSSGGAGGAGSGGSGGTGGGGAGGSGATSSSAMSGLPVPATSGVAQPSGAPGGLEVVDWAGFKSALTYTFDDSQPSHIEHYDALEGAGVPLTFYINSSRNSETGFDATWTQAVQDGHEIGNHTAHHCNANLTNCSGTALASAGAEIDDCTSYITSHFGQEDVWTMASPYGDGGWNGYADDRFFLNRGVGGGTIAPNGSTDPFNLPIHMALTNETANDFNGDIDSARSAGHWLIFLVHTISPTSANWYNPVDISTVTGSISHAKSLGDVWIDTTLQIGAYWRAQKVLSAVTPTTSGSDQTWSWTLPPHFPEGKYLRVTVTGGTVTQNGSALSWDDHGYFEIALDAGSVTVSP